MFCTQSGHCKCIISRNAQSSHYAVHCHGHICILCHSATWYQCRMPTQLSGSKADGWLVCSAGESWDGIMQDCLLTSMCLEVVKVGTSVVQREELDQPSPCAAAPLVGPSSCGQEQGNVQKMHHAERTRRRHLQSYGLAARPHSTSHVQATVP